MFVDEAPALPENIRLGWKCLPGTKAPAYYEKSQLTTVKSFITLATDVNIISETGSLPHPKHYTWAECNKTFFNCNLLIA